LAELWSVGAGLLSTQVLQEFYVNVTRKIKPPLNPSVAREVVRDYAPWVESPITPATVVRASEIGEIWQVSFWDGMILAAAEQSRADRVLTEDLSRGARIAGVEIVDPFSGKPFRSGAIPCLRFSITSPENIPNSRHRNLLPSNTEPFPPNS